MKFLVLCAFIAGASAGKLHSIAKKPFNLMTHRSPLFFAAYSSSQYRDGKATGLYNTVSTADGAYADKFPHGGTGYNGGFTTHYVSPNGGGVAAGAGTANFAPGNFGGGFAPGFGGGFGPGFGPTFNPAFGAPTVDFNNFFQSIQSNFAK